MREQQHEEPVSLLGLVSSALKDGASLSEEEVDQLARKVCRYIAARYAGKRVYVAEGSSLDRNQVREQVRQQFNGRNVVELMVRYGVSKATVYRWCMDRK